LEDLALQGGTGGEQALIDVLQSLGQALPRRTARYPFRAAEHLLAHQLDCVLQRRRARIRGAVVGEHRCLRRRGQLGRQLARGALQVRQQRLEGDLRLLVQRLEALDSLARLGRHALRLRRRTQRRHHVELCLARDLYDPCDVDLAQLDRRTTEHPHHGRRVARVGQETQPGDHIACACLFKELDSRRWHRRSI
jgi:hypothetical protein